MSNEVAEARMAPRRLTRMLMIALKVGVVALIATFATGLSLQAVYQLLTLFPDAVCHSQDSLLCNAPKWWGSYWWLSFLILFQPVLVLWTVALIPRFAKPGERLAVGGVLLIAVSAPALIITGITIGLGHDTPPRLLMMVMVYMHDAEVPYVGLQLILDLLLLVLGLGAYRLGRST